MSKVQCVVSSPVDTYSGYGARSRDFIKALIKAKPEWDVKLLSQRWGNTRFGFLDDHKELDLKSRIIPNMTQQPEVWVQISVPNEFKKIGKFSIGVTAGIETTICDASWIQGCNNMDLILTSCNHSKEVFEQTKYDYKDNRTGQTGVIELQKPVEVLFEGLDTDTYRKVDSKENTFDLSSIKETFCYLVVGHWMQGNFGHDRKNIGYTVKAFLETFKNKNNPPALILKTSQVGSSIIDRETILEKIDEIRKSVKGTLPNIYLLHGEVTDQEMNHLYNHPKIKAMVSFTKGEGFGRPLLEFTTTGKPVIASGWSGQLDFLHKEYAVLIPGELENVDKSAAVKNMILEQGKWFKPNDGAVGQALKNSFKKYKDYLKLSRKHTQYTLDNFTFQHMTEKLKNLLEGKVPEFPKQVNLNLPKTNISLPKLKKIGDSSNDAPKLKLPKLKKIDG